MLLPKNEKKKITIKNNENNKNALTRCCVPSPTSRSDIPPMGEVALSDGQIQANIW